MLSLSIQCPGWAQREQSPTFPNPLCPPTRAPLAGDHHHCYPDHSHDDHHRMSNLMSFWRWKGSLWKIFSFSASQLQKSIELSRPKQRSASMSSCRWSVHWYYCIDHRNTHINHDNSHNDHHSHHNHHACSSSPAKGARIAKPVARQVGVPTSPRYRHCQDYDD